MINTRKLTISKVGLFNTFLFACFVAVYEYLIVFYNMGNEISNWRYYIFAVVTFVAFITYLLEKRSNKEDRTIYGKELLYLLLTAILFYAKSISICNNIGAKLPFRVYVQISLFLLPAMYAYVLINIFDMKKIYTLMKSATIITIIMYFFEPAHTIPKFFDINNILNINLIHSVSFTESHNFFDTFLQLFLFFNYFKDKPQNQEQKKTLTIFYRLTLVFTLLSFKRLGILFVFLILLTKNIIHYDKKIKIPSFAIALFFVIITFFYTKLLQGELFNFGYKKLFDFTSGRNWFLQLWASHNYVSYGYGSSMLIIGRYLEMDLTQIFLELNLFCLFVYCYTFFKIPKKNLYANLVMLYVFFNMLTSSSLPWSIGWIIMFVNVSCISSNKIEEERENESKS